MEDHEMIAVPFGLLHDLALECQNYNLSVRADNLLATVKDSFTVAKDQHARDSMELRNLCSERDRLKTKRDALLADRDELLGALEGLEAAHCDTSPYLTKAQVSFGRKSLIVARAAIAKARGDV